jgi:DNA repair exonuclease SbcCD ATPase subunit
MSKIFGILTAVVLAVSAFIALKNKAAYSHEIDVRKATESKLEKTVERRDKATSELAATQDGHEKMKGEIPKVKQQEAAQKKTNDELAVTKTTKTQEVEANKAKLDQFREKTGALGNIKDLANKMSSMNNEIKDLDASIALNESKLAALTSENVRVDAQVSEQRKQAELRNKGESFSTLQARISSVYPNWGFVTLSAGNTAGVITNSTLDVIRNDEVIAKLLVTAVERNTASASIIPDSVKAGTVLMSGDRVVPGTKMETPTPAASPATVKPGN